ncbi:phage tail-collar fiber domain-containing protein [Desulfotruncus alcoholivorax]|uniref:phage tail-collar fiber domain-containing protein n=1 Tax=Desulfotruncus alcoholivorax TaxID=265477 RepID=UPI0003F6B50E|nr:phage tail protein [Desulfotruncus alcoholivorax]
MNSITTKLARISIARARNGEIVLPTVTHIAMGTGGHDPDDITKPIPPTEDDIQLENEVIRKPVASKERINDTAVRYSVILGTDEGNGYAFTEMGLIDSAGQLAARKTMGAKTKEPDVEMEFYFDEEF